MIFVEVFRLLLVLAAVAAGLQVGEHVGHSNVSSLVAVTLCVMVAYVIGGMIGRLFDRGLHQAVVRLRDMPPAEVFAGSLVGSTGLLVGLAFGITLVSLVHSSIGYPIAAVLAWVLCVGGVQLGVSKGQEIVRAAGMGHLLERGELPPESAVLVDTSALLDRQLMALGSAGLLDGGVVVPRFVIDEAQTLIDGPDPVSSRRARGGLEALEAIRRRRVVVRVEQDEVPELADSGEKALELAKRLHLRMATCSAELADRAQRIGVAVVNLRRLSAELAPLHAPGERLVVDLVKAGRQARQAVAYLPDGDMVVVNDAAHLVGHEHVAVVVSGSRPTSQGLLLFAHLDQRDLAGTGVPASV